MIIWHVLSSSECDSLPLLKLLGKSLNVNTTNVRLYIKSLEKKVVEMVEQIKFDEVGYCSLSLPYSLVQLSIGHEMSTVCSKKILPLFYTP